MNEKILKKLDRLQSLTWLIFMIIEVAILVALLYGAITVAGFLAAAFVWVIFLIVWQASIIYLVKNLKEIKEVMPDID